MGTLLEIARIGGHIVHKVIAIHNSGADKEVIEALETALKGIKEVHRIIHRHWIKTPKDDLGMKDS